MGRETRDEVCDGEGKSEWKEEAANQLEAEPNHCLCLYQRHEGFKLVNDPATNHDSFDIFLVQFEGMGAFT